VLCVVITVVTVLCVVITVVTGSAGSLHSCLSYFHRKWADKERLPKAALTSPDHHVQHSPDQGTEDLVLDAALLRYVITPVTPDTDCLVCHHCQVWCCLGMGTPGQTSTHTGDVHLVTEAMTRSVATPFRFPLRLHKPFLCPKQFLTMCSM
jgi:hypothetical protein